MRRPRKAINQINVVPYIDVMLVLLVIFMVTAPLVSPGEIELPSVGSKLTAREQIETVVNMVWKFVTLSSSTAYQEILMASRTDPELKRALEPLEKEFEEALLELVKGLFPRWEGREELETAHDVATFLLTGMNLSHMRSRKKLRSKRVLASLSGTVEGLYRRARRVDRQLTE